VAAAGEKKKNKIKQIWRLVDYCFKDPSLSSSHQLVPQSLWEQTVKKI
jgi:hypothetical protein